jgi:DHA1 family tetracycline resistance protein-like MFS transporter
MTEPIEYESAWPADRRPPPPKGAMLAIFLIVLSDLMGFGLIIPSLPFYARQFHASDFQVGLIFTIFSFCQLIATPILGLTSDRVGRRPVLIFSQCGSVAGYLVLALATARQWMNPLTGLLLVYTSRIIDGISGGNISTAQAYVSDVTPPEGRARGMGILGAAFGIGFSIGPAVGGVLAHFHPSLPALGAATCSFLAALQSILHLKEPARHSHEGEEEAMLFLHPARFLPILRNRALVQLLGVSFVSMIAFVMMESVFAIFMNDRFGFRELAVGGFFAMAGVTIIIVQGGLMGRLTKLLGEWTLVIAGPMLVTSAMLIYVLIAWRWSIGVQLGVAMVLLAGLFNATGRSIQTPALSSLVSQASDPRQQGTVFGLYHMLGSLARVLGPMIATGSYSRYMTAPFAIAAALMASVALWAAMLHARISMARSPLAAAAGVQVSAPHE